MNSDRFRFFPSVHRESDLLLGVPHHDFQDAMPHVALKEQIRLYNLLALYSDNYTEFKISLDPLPVPEETQDLAPEIVTMFRCGLASGTGPMSSVAGLFAETVARRLEQDFAPGELVIENGGDLCIRNNSELLSVIHAGDSSLSGKLALVIPPGSWGVCTSSGTHGHSYSQGKADAVTIVSESTPLADAWATSLANRVTSEQDIPLILEEASGIPDIISLVVIVGEQVGIRGKFEVKPLS